MRDIRKLFEPGIRKAGIRKVAERLDVSHVTLLQWLGGSSSLGEEKVATLAKLLGFRITTKVERVGKSKI